MTSSFIKRFKVRLAIRLAIKLVGSVSLEGFVYKVLNLAFKVVL